jgi:hypothetical protein
MVAREPIETPAAAMDARETLIQQQQALERQRREIEELRRQLELRTEEPMDGAVTPSIVTTNNEGATPPRPSAPKKRKLASRAPGKDGLAADDGSLSEVEGAMDAMDGAMAEMGGAMDAMDGAMAEASSCVVHKDMELMGVEDVEDAFEFDGQKNAAGHQVVQAPWSGFPMLRNEASTLGACIP